MITSSRKQTLKDLNLVFYGPPGSGKTFVAGSASKYWPENITEKRTEWITLKDMFSVGVDAGATDGFAQHKIDCPLISFVDALKENGDDVAAAIRGIVNELKSAVEKNKEEDQWIVVDTISMLDRYFTDFYEPLSKDGYTLYRNVLNAHKRLYSSLSLIPARKIYLCHSKAFVSDEAKAKLQRQAKSALAAEIAPDITGQAHVIYIGNSSLEGIVLTTSSGGNNPVLTRKIHTRNIKGFEGKNRWEAILPAEMEPNVRKLLKMIQTNLDF